MNPRVPFAKMLLPLLLLSLLPSVCADILSSGSNIKGEVIIVIKIVGTDYLVAGEEYRVEVWVHNFADYDTVQLRFLNLGVEADLSDGTSRNIAEREIISRDDIPISIPAGGIKRWYLTFRVPKDAVKIDAYSTGIAKRGWNLYSFITFLSVSVSKEVQALKNRVAVLEDENNELRKELENVKRELAWTQKENTELKGKVDRLTTENENLREENRKLKDDIARKEIKIEYLAGELQVARTQIYILAVALLVAIIGAAIYTRRKREGGEPRPTRQQSSS